jgi:hypothetical protein
MHIVGIFIVLMITWKGKNIVKRTTQVSGHSLNYIFVCLKDHKWSIIVWIVIKILEYFSLIAKFTCSKLDTNKKCFCMFKAFKPQKWTILIFFKHFFFLPNVHRSFFKLKRILTLMIRSTKGLEFMILKKNQFELYS